MTDAHRAGRVPVSERTVGAERVGPFVVSVGSIRVGDLVHVAGRLRPVRDMRDVSGRRKRLFFAGRVTYLLSPASSLRAYREQPPLHPDRP